MSGDNLSKSEKRDVLEEFYDLKFSNREFVFSLKEVRFLGDPGEIEHLLSELTLMTPYRIMPSDHERPDLYILCRKS